MTTNNKLNRRQQILEVLASELETNPGARITTASLAKAVGVSEAALYRHFASKAKMFEALIDFAEESVFGLINKIVNNETDATVRCEKIIQLMLGFSEKNPGITRILIGDALLGENERLRTRVMQFFERLDTQFRQILREANLSGGPRAISNMEAASNQMLTHIEGKLSQFVRSSFTKKPTEHWADQWVAMRTGLFR
ncbi:MAG TPA: nucleoid occlusion factor SlmA [Thiotrichaceae bacterium]|jgi:TetR/AcrR family transcriptional regulator|nr:nucleoid occlusion factor SlmA [Thiotrichaceae bacterium]HIM08702.1 nucleoid occlusion factor SlmA [Gammaproteobacteria bacterium]